MTYVRSNSAQVLPQQQGLFKVDRSRHSATFGLSKCVPACSRQKSVESDLQYGVVLERPAALQACQVLGLPVSSGSG